MLAKNSSSRKCILLISFENAFKSYNASVLTFQIPLVKFQQNTATIKKVMVIF